MPSCSVCGRKGEGVRGHVLSRSCVICRKVGCAHCLTLTYVVSETDVVGDISMTAYGKAYTGCCSQDCEREYWRSEIAKHPPKIAAANERGFDFFEPEFYIFNIVAVTSTPDLDADKITRLSHYLDKPLAQGITMMYEGYKSLEHRKITDGLRLCRNDPMYEKMAKDWVDDLARRYVGDLKSFDVPTAKAEVGGISITLTMPQNQKELKLRSCPSCGAGMDQVAVRGQVVKCRFCSSTFEIT